ncbi:MAG TPA: hypothetical protein PKE38_15225 [Ignavibacteriaceae bacterium]|nr:hypothetical protein [Ignavibacteriaceae bacterium]
MDILNSLKWLWNHIYYWSIWNNDFFMSILGGVFAAFVFLRIQRINRYFRKRKFKFLLGSDADLDSEFYLVYAKLALPPLVDDQNKLIQRPYYKPRIRQNRQADFSMTYPVSSCEVRGLKYLSSSLLSKFSGNSKLVADIDECIDEVLDLSFISLGGPLSNYKTEDLLSNESNIFLKMGPINFLTLDGKPILKNFEPEHDYGIIIKIRPKEFPDRVWIACAGLGEWGTSGSAWFLSHKYSELLEKIKNPMNLFAIGEGKDFVAIIKVKQNQDESAKLMKLFSCNKEIDNFITEQEKYFKVKQTNDEDNDSGLTVQPTGSISPDMPPSGIGAMPYMDGTSGNYIYVTPIHTQSSNKTDENDKKETSG